LRWGRGGLRPTVGTIGDPGRRFLGLSARGCGRGRGQVPAGQLLEVTPRHPELVADLHHRQTRLTPRPAPLPSEGVGGCPADPKNLRRLRHRQERRERAASRSCSRPWRRRGFSRGGAVGRGRLGSMTFGPFRSGWVDRLAAEAVRRHDSPVSGRARCRSPRPADPHLHRAELSNRRRQGRCLRSRHGPARRASPPKVVLWVVLEVVEKVVFRRNHQVSTGGAATASPDCSAARSRFEVRVRMGAWSPTVTGASPRSVRPHR
jgi:hypothetical protein